MPDHNPDDCYHRSRTDGIYGYKTFLQKDWQVKQTIGRPTVGATVLAPEHLGTVFKACGDEKKHGNWTVFAPGENPVDTYIFNDLDDAIERVIAAYVTTRLLKGT